MTEKRGTTTRQMLDAPQDSIYVWPDHHLAYPATLALLLDRTDLRIVSPGWLTPEHILGEHPLPTIIRDHAAQLTGQQWDAWEIYLARKKP